MSRWIPVKALESYEVSLFEQALFIAKGLPAYNRDGKRVIERQDEEDLPIGCVYLTGDLGPFGEGDTIYYRWLDAPDELRDLKFKKDELVAFLTSEQDKPGIKRIIDTLPISSWDSSIVDYKKLLISSQEEISRLRNELETLKQKTNKSSQGTQQLKTDRATQSRQDRAIADWTITVEKAVSLAVTCTRNGKPKSIEQHKNMWRVLWAADNDTLPRSAGFEAFRRGLPDDLKGTS
ncbi:hypothetical protein [Solidesulfovibrio magneticus]|nr:hypothetical protein [Solidesulfovibrio magneticus]